MNRQDPACTRSSSLALATPAGASTSIFELWRRFLPSRQKFFCLVRRESHSLSRQTPQCHQFLSERTDAFQDLVRHNGIFSTHVPQLLYSPPYSGKGSLRQPELDGFIPIRVLLERRQDVVE